jgi:hypothetical protein
MRKDIRQLIGASLNVAKSVIANLAIAAIMNQRNGIAIGVPVAYIAGHVVAIRDVPAKRAVDVLIGIGAFDEHDLCPLPLSFGSVHIERAAEFGYARSFVWTIIVRPKLASLQVRCK